MCKLLHLMRSSLIAIHISGHVTASMNIFHGCKMQFRCNSSDATTPTYKLMHNNLNINLVLPHFNVEYIIQII